jgi:ketosteroid isomerase-like protein
MSSPTPEQRLLIRDLYDRYSWALDTGDLDGVRALFAPGATVTAHAPGGHAAVATTPEEVDETLVSWLSDPEVVGRQHHVTTLIVDPDPEGRPGHWRVRTYFVVTKLDIDPLAASLVWSGFGDDVVAEVDGAWRIVVREVSLWQGPILARFEALRS